jgi:hypothetical protein
MFHQGWQSWPDIQTCEFTIGPLFDVKAHSRSLGSPRFPVKDRSFGGFHAALYGEPHTLPLVEP